MADGVVLLDGEGKVQLVNDSLRRLFGLTWSAGQGLSILEAFGVPALAELAARLPCQKSVVGFELELAKTPRCYLEVNASAVRARDGAYRGAIFVFHDLTRV